MSITPNLEVMARNIEDICNMIALNRIATDIDNCNAKLSKNISRKQRRYLVKQRENDRKEIVAFIKLCDEKRYKH